MTQNNELVLAFDPGVKGALAVFVNGELTRIWDLPTHPVKVGTKTRNRIMPTTLLSILKDIKQWWRTTDSMTIYVILEVARPRPHEGGVGAFTSGQGYGYIEMASAAIGAVLYYVEPAQWKRTLKLNRDKSKSRTLAESLFPKFSHWFMDAQDDGRAEAALIGHWWLTRGRANVSV